MFLSISLYPVIKIFQNFINIVRAVFEILAKNIKNTPKLGFFPICDPQDFIQKSGSVTFVLLWCPNFMQKLDKTNGRPLRYPNIVSTPP